MIVSCRDTRLAMQQPEEVAGSSSLQCSVEKGAHQRRMHSRFAFLRILDFLQWRKSECTVGSLCEENPTLCRRDLEVLPLRLQTEKGERRQRRERGELLCPSRS